jgi:hypothetical protein
VTERVARVLPDVRGIDKEFDYSMPDDMDERAEVGTIVRVALHGRRVRVGDGPRRTRLRLGSHCGPSPR